MNGPRDFLSQAAPENYVAGIGRGAVGFTTRSDLGPARDGPSEDQIQAAVAKRTAQLGLNEGKGGKDDEDDDQAAAAARYQDPDNEVGLFAGGIYDKDDEEADEIWATVDDRMAKRRQKQREAREAQEQADYELKNPKIQQQFAQFKRALVTVTDEEWASLPDVKDMTGKTKREREERKQRFYAVPDSVLAAARDAGEFGTSVADDGSADNKDGGTTNFAKIGAARDKVLQARLDQASQSSGTVTALGTSSTVNPKGYLSSLEKSGKLDQATVADFDYARKLLKSAIVSNPNHAPAWMAAARVEILAGKTVAARNLLQQGCKNCPKHEDIWVEYMNVWENHLNAKIIAKEAVTNNPRNIRLWVERMKLEKDTRSKKSIIRAALDNVPESEMLWKEAVSLEEDPADVRLLLGKAVELIPSSVDLWLALARLETPDQAQKVLAKAQRANPTSHEIWIWGARLTEQIALAANAKPDRVGKLMERAVRTLAKQSAMPKREEWIAEAETCEKDGVIITCKSIIEETLGWGLDEDDDRKDTWMDDAKQSIGRGRYATARAIYAYACRVFINSKTIWLAAVDLERNYGTKEAIQQILEKAVEACPRSDVLWLMLAKEKLLAGNLDEARKVLGRAFNQNPNSEDIWLAAVKLEADHDSTNEARTLLKTAREKAPTDRVWMRSIVFERQLGNLEEALELVQEALQLFPATAKLWMLKGQIYQDIGKLPQAREAYSTGVKAVPKSIPLWLLYSRLEEKAGLVVKCRSVLDRARQANPKSAELWCELIRVERRAGNLAQAKNLMASAQKEMPKTGILWSERIWHLEPRQQRKPLSQKAYTECPSDPEVFVSTARVFASERKLPRAQHWFEQALVLDSDLGDSWAWYYKFLLEYGTKEKRDDVVAKCVANAPRYGEYWQPIAKDPKNARASVEDVLKLVVASLPG